MKKIAAMLALIILFVSIDWQSVVAYSIPQTFLLQSAKQLALANSKDLKKMNNEIILKNMKYTESIANIQAKMKNKQSFRYSPLLSFHFPEKLDMVEEYDLNMKPVVLRSEITTLCNKLNDARYDVIQKTTSTYIDVYCLQEKIKYTETSLKAAEDELTANRARLLLGTATEEDIKKMEKSVESLTSDLALLKRSFENGKKTLFELTNVDVSQGFVFKNPLITADIPREELQNIVDYTLGTDFSHYTTKVEASVANINLSAYEKYMYAHFGGDMGIIAPYLSATREGIDIDYAAFQISYKQFLTCIDAYWAGSYKILFLHFPKVWFKGSIAGTRYIEDEMYAIYTACMEYSSAKRAVEASVKEVTKNVETSFESIVTASNAYQSLIKSTSESEAQLERVSALNKLGKATYDEYKDAQANYQEMMMETLDSLVAYNQLLVSYDRLTSGYVSKYFKGEDLDLNVIGGEGQSNKELPYYNIYTAVEDMVFVFSVEMPEDFLPEVTDFEIWYDGVQLGDRTPTNKTIRHLALDYGENSILTVRLYSEQKFVGETTIDTTIARDVLNIKSAEPPKEAEEPILATYEVATNNNDVSTSELTLELAENFSANYFTLKYGNSGNVYTSDYNRISEKFTYLTLLIRSLGEVEISFFDEAKTLVAKGTFDTEKGTIKRLN